MYVQLLITIEIMLPCFAFFSFHSLFPFSDSSVASIGTTKNTEQASDTAKIIASVFGVIIFLLIVVVLLALVGIRCYR